MAADYNGREDFGFRSVPAGEKARLVRDEADAFIEKPFEVSDLVSAVQQLLMAYPEPLAVAH